MQRNTFFEHHIYVFLGFGIVLFFAVLLIFFDGYVPARETSENSSTGIVVMFSSSSLSDVINPVFVSSLSFDLDSDASFQKYLSTETPFEDVYYVPQDLAPIESNFTANDARKFKLRKEAGDMFADMAWHFRSAFSGDRLAIFSAYRSKSYQDGLLKKGCSLSACAKGGTSEHQAGLAVDLRIVTKGGRSMSMDVPNTYTDWLHAHAHEWGFHNTYQKGIAIDGKIVEGWHWRYVGIELATLLREKGMTIAEYYNGIRNEEGGMRN